RHRREAGAGGRPEPRRDRPVGASAAEAAFAPRFAMSYCRAILQRPHWRQWDSKICTASRRAPAYGPTKLPGSSARNSRMISPTPCLPHFFAPITRGSTWAAAISMARETFAFVSNATLPSQVTPQFGAKDVQHNRRRRRLVKPFLPQPAAFEANHGWV